MLFNSFTFILLFLPLVILCARIITDRYGYIGSLRFLLLASLFFYGYWNPIYLALLVGSVIANFLIATKIVNSLPTRGRRWLTVGVCLNLGLIGLFKYADFIVSTVNWLPDIHLPQLNLVLPLAISFFTFQQIAFLMDIQNTRKLPCAFNEYAFFVTFFPQLIAGPIVHHSEVIPQYRNALGESPKPALISMGMCLFILGLGKKVLIADNVASYSTPIFDAVAVGYSPGLLESWIGALAYTFQLYFDFSGYCDMAIGLGLLFGIHLPINFNSPYKAHNIIDFWRRWHITLSRFLKDYLYIPLGGSRKGDSRRYQNIAITMLLGGLWHGASWSFILWGGLHGFYLIVNNLWISLVKQMPKKNIPLASLFLKTAGWLLTFIAVVVGWVLFRADDIASAIRMLEGMAGMNGASLPNSYAQWIPLLPQWVQHGIDLSGPDFEEMLFYRGKTQLLVLLGLLLTVLLLPNSLEVVGYTQSPNSKLKWKPNTLWASLVSIIFVASLLSMNTVSEFLYFQF